MKVLFVCNANVGRSQVAQVCLEQLSKHEVSSAGISVDRLVKDRPSSKMKDVPNLRSVEYIKREFGVDISERDRQQLTRQLIAEVDLAIIIHEREAWPDYLQEGDQLAYWDIPDTVEFDDDGAYGIWREVRRRVEDLVREIG